MKRIISNKSFIKSVVGVIYRMSPENKPRNIEKIVDYIKNHFLEIADYKENSGYCSLGVEEKDFYKFVHDFMFGCPEFVELNKSQYELEHPEKELPQFVAIDRYTSIKPEYDFIDLDACVRNIVKDYSGEFLDDDLFEGRCEIVYKKELEK